MAHAHYHKPSFWEKITDMETLSDMVMFSSESHSITAGLASGLVASFLSNSIQQKEADIFPVLYSDVRDIRSKDLTEAVSFYAAVNDMAMATTQSWNKAREEEGYQAFYKEWEFARGSKYAGRVEREGRLLLSKLEPHLQLANELKIASTLFSNSWQYRNKHNYRRKIYWTKNAKGKKIMRTKRVYVNSDHYFTFYPKKAAQAREQLENVISQYPGESLYNPGLASVWMSVDEEDIDAIQRTVLEDSEKKLAKKDAENYVNQWSQEARLKQVAQNTLSFLSESAMNSSKMMETIALSKKSYHFKTTSKSHDGPEGYELSNKLSEACQNSSSDINEVLQSINLSIKNAEKLKKLRQPSAIQKKLSKPVEQASKALDLGVESYLICFPQSIIDMDQRVSHGKTAFIGLGVCAGVGLATYILHPFSGFIHY